MAFKSVGIDISERSVEAVALVTKKGTRYVEAAVRAEIPAGTIVRGVVEDIARLAAVLSGVLDDLLGPKRRTVHVGLSIPEEIVYSRTFRVPSGLDAELAGQAIALEAPESFPIPMDDVVSDYALVSRGKEQNEYLYVVAERDAVVPYVQALEEAGAQARFIDAQSMALARALLPKKEAEPVLIADIGRRATTLVISELGKVRSSQDVLFGGDMLNDALERQLKVTMAEAEQLKVKAGFNLDIEDGRLVLIMQRPMTVLTDEMSRTMRHYAESTGRAISRIVVAGGNSLVPGIIDYFSTSFGQEAVPGDPLVDVVPGEALHDKRFKRHAILYANAIGVALRITGVRDVPALDLLPRISKKDGGLLPALRGKLGSITTLFGTMAPAKKPKSTKASTSAAKKAPAKKRVAKKKAPAKKTAKKSVAKKAAPKAAVEEVEESAVPAAAPTPAPEAEMKKVAPAAPEASAEAPPASEPPASVKEESVAPAPEAEVDAAKEASEAPAAETLRKPSVPHVFGEGGEHAFGRGVGDLLGSVTTGDALEHTEEDDAEEGALPSEATGKISISSILNKTADDEEADDEDVTDDDMEDDTMEEAPEGAEDELFEEEEEEEEAAPRAERKHRGPVLLLVTVLLVIVILAVAGVMMFLRKNGSADTGFLSGLFGGGAAPQVTEQPAQPAAPEAPTSVSANFLVATTNVENVALPVLTTRAVETDVSLSDTFDATGEVQKDDAVARGTITVVNKSSRPYTFIATTRFLNPDGVLFRMAKTTSIPANGSVDVEVYADVPGATGDIGPSTFVIPGLGEALYETIYGRSDAAMTGGSGTAAAVSEEDLAAARSSLADRLESEAGKNFKVMVQDGERILPDLITANELEFDAPDAGTEGSSFKATLKLRFRALMVPENDVLPMLQDKLKGLGLDSAQLGTVLYTVQAYDTTTESAEVRAEAPIL